MLVILERTVLSGWVRSDHIHLHSTSTVRQRLDMSQRFSPHLLPWGDCRVLELRAEVGSLLVLVLRKVWL